MDEDKPDAIVPHLGSNDLISKDTTIDTNIIVVRIIGIGKTCKDSGAIKVIVSSLLLKSNFKLRKMIKQVNDLLYDECKDQKFGYVSNDLVTRQFLWKDGVHLTNNGVSVFASNVANFLILFDFGLANDWLLERCSGRGSETLLSNFRVQNHNEMLIVHLNMNSLFPFPYISIKISC